MISAIRNNKKILVTSVLLVILGAWLPLACQHCLAYAALNPDIQQKMPHEHCQHDNNPDDTKTGYVSVYQPDMYGCGGQQLLASIANKPSDQITKLHNQKLLSHIHLTGLNVPVPAHATGTGIKPFMPDRACYHPLERNCIQLK